MAVYTTQELMDIIKEQKNTYSTEELQELLSKGQYPGDKPATNVVSNDTLISALSSVQGEMLGPPTPTPETQQAFSYGTEIEHERRIRGLITQQQERGVDIKPAFFPLFSSKEFYENLGPFKEYYEAARTGLPSTPERVGLLPEEGQIGPRPDYVALGGEGTETAYESRQRIYKAWENGDISTSQLRQGLQNLENENEFIQRIMTEDRLFSAPAKKTGARVTQTLSNLLDLANILKHSNYLSPFAQNLSPYSLDNDPISNTTKEMRLNATQKMKEAMGIPEPKNLLEALSAGVQEAGPVILEFGLLGKATKLAGPSLGALHGLLSNTHNEQGELDPVRAAQGTAFGYLMFKALQKGEKLPPVLMSLYSGGVFSGFPMAVEAGKEVIGLDSHFPSFQEATTDFLIGAALGLPESRGLRFREQLRFQLENSGLSKKEAAKVETEIMEAIKALSKEAPKTRDELFELAKSKIGNPAEKVEEHNGDLAARLRQSVLDDLEGILYMHETNPNIPEKMKDDIIDSYNSARLTRGKSAVAVGTTRYGRLFQKEDGAWTFKGKSLKKILGQLNSNELDNWLLWMAGRRAKTLSRPKQVIDPFSGMVLKSKPGRKTPWSKEEVDVLLSLETPKFRKIAEEYAEWNKANLDFAVKKGILSKEARDRFDDQTYIPFYRVARQLLTGRSKFKGIMPLKGGTGNIRDLLDNMLANNSMLIEAGIMNEAYLKIIDTARKVKAEGLVRPANKEAVETHNILLKESLLADGVPEIEISGLMNSPAQLTRSRKNSMTSNVVTVFREGLKENWIIEDPMLFRSIQSLNRPIQNEIISLLGKVRGAGQKSVTLSFEFLGANMSRDTVLASILSKSGFRPILDTLIGLKSRIMTDPNYKEYIANGGGVASYHRNAESFRKEMDLWLVSKGIDPNTVMNTGRRTVEAFEKLAEGLEMATRLGEFRLARKKGVPISEAVMRGREISVDFAMRGDSQYINYLYDTALFLKAGVNGIDRLYRGLTKDSNRGAVAAKVALMGMMSAQLHLLNRDNPLYEELPQWDKDTNFHLFIPTVEYLIAKNIGKGDLIPLRERYYHRRIPRLWEVGAMSRVFDIALEATLNKEFRGRALAEAVHTITGVMNFDFVPFALRPLVDVAKNKLSFFDTPIESPTDLARKSWSRGDPGNTSRTMRELMLYTRHAQEALEVGKWPDVFQPSAPKVEAILRGYLNAWYAYGIGVSDWLLFDNQPAINWDRNPLIRRFVGTQPPKTTKFLQELYQIMNEANKTRATMKYYAQFYRKDIAEEQAFTPENMLYQLGTQADNYLQGISKAMKHAEATTTLEETRKLAKIVDGSLMPKDRKFIEKAKVDGSWDNMAYLKRMVINKLLERRAEYAQEVMRVVNDGSKERDDQLKVLMDKYEKKKAREANKIQLIK